MLTELNSHKEIHLNDKSYSYDVCQTSYTKQSVLMLHNKTQDKSDIYSLQKY